jgi:hypothetical protein
MMQMLLMCFVVHLMLGANIYVQKLYIRLDCSKGGR